MKTLGDHLRKVRLDKKLTQEQVGRELGVVEVTITAWEKGKTNPSVRQIPKILGFLGYNPLKAPESLQEKLKYYRMTKGLSQGKLARMLDMDEHALAWIERGKNKPNKDVPKSLLKFLSSLETREVEETAYQACPGT